MATFILVLEPNYVQGLQLTIPIGFSGPSWQASQDFHSDNTYSIPEVFLTCTITKFMHEQEIVTYASYTKVLRYARGVA